MTLPSPGDGRGGRGTADWPRSFAVDSLACLRGERMVFSRLGFSLAAGGAALLTGPNGAGKSSLLRLLAGLLPPFHGQILWDGAALAPDDPRHRARIGWVGHLEALKPAFTVRETLAHWVALAAAAGSDRAAAVAEGLAAFELTHLASLPCRFLSAGQRRRLGLARLVALPAPLWLLDEPGTALDRASLARLAAQIARHRAAGGMVILATHGDLAEDPALAGAVAVTLADAATADAAGDDDNTSAAGSPMEGGS